MPQPSLPDRFGKYRVLRRIAVGGTAEIYEARLDGIGGFQRTFAIKRILPHLSGQAEFMDMLVEEAKVAGLLSHANIVQIMDLGQEAGDCFIAMEFVRGPDLGAVLARCRDKGIALPVPHAVFVASEMLKALEYAHTRQVVRNGRLIPLDIVHRDISPANILLSLQGEVKLTDFGIAKASVNALQTVSGVIKGRFDYMSPEQSAGDPVDARTDLFATGVVLYEMLTGRHPFRRNKEPATLDAIRAGDFKPPSAHNPDVPHALELVVQKALAVDPDDRWTDATDMKDALDRFFHEAGFIFTHTTLAAFLRGLFPQAVPRPSGPTLAPTATEAGGLSRSDHLSVHHRDDTRPLERPQADDDDDRPTRIQWDEAPADDGTVEDDVLAGIAPLSDHDLGRVETELRPVPPEHRQRTRDLLDGLADMSRSVATAQITGLGDESTLIRPSPLTSGGVSPGAEDDFNTAATRIRPSPLRNDEDDDAVLLPDPEDWDDEATRIRKSPAEASAPVPARSIAETAPPPARMTPPPAPAPRAQPPAAAPPPSGAAQALYIVGGALAAAALVLVGAFLGMQYARQGASSMVTDTPKLEVVRTTDTDQITVNGVVLQGRGPHLLGAGRHKVRLEPTSGAAPIEAWIELSPREYRILSFTEAEAADPSGRR